MDTTQLLNALDEIGKGVESEVVRFTAKEAAQTIRTMENNSCFEFLEIRRQQCSLRSINLLVEESIELVQSKKFFGKKKRNARINYLLREIEHLTSIENNGKENEQKSEHRQNGGT